MSWITRVLHSNHCHKGLKPTYTISLCSTAVSEATRIDKFCHARLAENAACGVADTSNLHRADLRGDRGLLQAQRTGTSSAVRSEERRAGKETSNRLSTTR